MQNVFLKLYFLLTLYFIPFILSIYDGHTIPVDGSLEFLDLLLFPNYFPMFLYHCARIPFHLHIALPLPLLFLFLHLPLFLPQSLSLPFCVYSFSFSFIHQIYI